MFRVKKILKSNMQIIIRIIIGTLLSITTVYAVTAVLNADQVDYDNSNSSLLSTNVQNAIDELFAITKRRVTGDGAENVGFQTNRSNTKFANSNGLCVVINRKLVCFKTDNYEVEKEHLKQVFYDNTKCTQSSDEIYCQDFGYYCRATEEGLVSCTNMQAGSYTYCDVFSDGTIDCT